MRIVVIIILSLMIGYILRPVYPYLDYVINKEYIAKILCINKDKPELKCNGKCHLINEIKKQATEENKPLFPFGNQIQENILLWFHPFFDNYLTDLLNSSYNRYSNYIKIYNYLSFYYFFHPPD